MRSESGVGTQQFAAGPRPRARMVKSTGRREANTSQTLQATVCRQAEPPRLARIRNRGIQVRQSDSVSGRYQVPAVSAAVVASSTSRPRVCRLSSKSPMAISLAPRLRPCVVKSLSPWCSIDPLRLSDRLRRP